MDCNKVNEKAAIGNLRTEQHEWVSVFRTNVCFFRTQNICISIKIPRIFSIYHFAAIIPKDIHSS